MKTEKARYRDLLKGEQPFLCRNCNKASYQEDPIQDGLLYGVECDYCGQSFWWTAEKMRDNVTSDFLESPLFPVCYDHGDMMYNSNSEQWVCLFCED